MYCFIIFQKGLRRVFDESSQTAWFFCTTSNIYRYNSTISHKTLRNYIPVFSGRITLSIGKNRMNIRTVVFEFCVSRQTDRLGGGLCFIICIYKENDVSRMILCESVVFWCYLRVVKLKWRKVKKKTGYHQRGLQVWLPNPTLESLSAVYIYMLHNNLTAKGIEFNFRIFWSRN